MAREAGAGQGPKQGLLGFTPRRHQCPLRELGGEALWVEALDRGSLVSRFQVNFTFLLYKVSTVSSNLSPWVVGRAHQTDGKCRAGCGADVSEQGGSRGSDL